MFGVKMHGVKDDVIDEDNDRTRSEWWSVLLCLSLQIPLTMSVTEGLGPCTAWILSMACPSMSPALTKLWIKSHSALHHECLNLHCPLSARVNAWLAHCFQCHGCIHSTVGAVILGLASVGHGGLHCHPQEFIVGSLVVVFDCV